jgi:hypothetical protein
MKFSLCISVIALLLLSACGNSYENENINKENVRSSKLLVPPCL